MNSLIVPVYNAKKTIDRLVNSVPDDWELILVEDGSTEPITPPKKAVYIQQENQGPGSARNTGLRHATGDYVFFADADDELIPVDWTPYLNGSLSGKIHDMVYAGFVNDGPDGKYQIYTKPTGCVYGVAYRRKFLLENDIWFPPLMQMEDVAFNTICQNVSDNWASLMGCTYVRHVTPGSIMTTRDFNKTAMPNHVKADVYVFNYFKGEEKAYRLMSKNLSYYYYEFMAICPRMTDQEIEEWYAELKNWQKITRTMDNLIDFEKYKECNRKAAIRRLGEFEEFITMDEFFERIRQ